MALFSRRSARTEAASPSPRLSELTAVEQAWIDSLIAIVADTGTDIGDVGQIRDLYEKSVTQWHRVNPPERVDPHPMINAIGSALGEHLVLRTQLRWMIADDGHRTELALHEPRSKMLLYPTDLVAERWIAHDGGEFIPAIVHRVVAALPVTSGRRRA